MKSTVIYDSTTIQEFLQRAILEYDAHRQNRGQWLDPQIAQQLVDHLQSASP
ncbi:hypothetical protein GYMLUDRAFT_49403 [Collybiopsis luxurians FD-317 M1]|uniref:Uncharacterized protein n=1 Tax=Collybiopsis luxurians FD-317 M1 TaxID=944289 RepID=A0A0D0CEJ0_9AGAR|nr:hypothetical protein GYMLUDRAFT_49403 [Collybiopsis luxurians FD-317 M1]